MSPSRAKPEDDRRGRRSRTGAAAGVVLAVVTLTACGGPGRSTPTPTPTLEATVPAFEQLSGLTIPSDATGTSVRVVVQEPAGVPAYRVEFQLPNPGVDAFCQAGGMQRPLRADTVPPTYRDQFAYAGDGAPGVEIADGALPSDLAVQRIVLATGTDTARAQVRVSAYRQPR